MEREMLKGKVRLACRSDTDHILNVINTTNNAFYRDVIPQEKFMDPFITRERLTADLQKWHFYVYEINERIIGTVALEKPSSEKGTVYRLYVLPEYQRRGVARTLMEEVERKAKQLGLKHLTLRVHFKAHWAVSFYQKIGYCKVGEIDYQRGRDHVLQKTFTLARKRAPSVELWCAGV